MEPMTTAEEKKIHSQEEPWSDSFALKVAKADFEAAENYRAQSHDPRWMASDTLYLGWEKQRHWEGTKIPRSSLGMFVVFSQVESLLPKVLSSIFADNPWFEVGPQPGTTAIDATRVRDLMLYQMQRQRLLKNESIRESLRLSLKDGFLYGFGPLEIGWHEVEKKTRKYARFNDSMSGTSEVIQVGGRQMLRSPFLRHRQARDVYVDPAHDRPQLQSARFVCTRGYMTVDELLAKKDSPGFSIPPKTLLIELAKSKPHASVDSNKTAVESIMGGSYDPNENTSVDPGALRLEVVTRWSSDRAVWMLNQQELAYNDVNTYGFIPVFNCFYVDVPGRCYGLSVADVTEGEHRLQGSVINARIDELALHIHGQTVRKRGIPVPAHQRRRYPGQNIETDNPKDDFVFNSISPALQQAFLEVNGSELRVQKTTGITDLALMGVPGSGGNSANRTATGIGVQAQAAFSRLTYLIENIEDMVVEPILSYWHQLNTEFLDTSEILEIVGPESTEVQQIDPLNILNADVLFTMRASSKMQSRMSLMQMFQAIAQTFLNPALVSQLQRTGYTIDVAELFHVVLDATGYKARGQFIRPMNDEEKQALQQAASQEQNVDLVKQRERMAAMKEIREIDNEARMETEIVKRAMDAAVEEESAD